MPTAEIEVIPWEIGSKVNVLTTILQFLFHISLFTLIIFRIKYTDRLCVEKATQIYSLKPLNYLFMIMNWQILECFSFQILKLFYHIKPKIKVQR